MDIEKTECVETGFKISQKIAKRIRKKHILKDQA
jgi:Zn ribbon nucleic-acid-binding protein